MSLAQYARFWARMPIALACDLLRLLVAKRGGAAQVNALCDLYRDIGRLAAMFGGKYEEYGRARALTDGSGDSRHAQQAG
jgi:hypothetical protein